MKQFITRSLIAASIALVALSVVPTGAVAQMVYYSGYNAAPYWPKLSNPIVIQGQTLSINLSAIDENGDQLSYTLVNAPAGAAFNQATKVFSFTPNYTQLGSFPVTISATDGKSAPAVATFYVSVTTDYGRYVYGGGDAEGYFNQAPYFTSTNSYYSANSGSLLTFTVTAIDPEGSEVRYSVSGLPAGASFDAARRQFSWTPTRSQRGAYALSFYATDGNRTSIPLTVSIVVDGGAIVTSASAYYPQVPPTYTAPSTYQYAAVAGCQTQLSAMPKTAPAGRVFTYVFGNCDSSGRPVTTSLVVGPTGASLTNGVLRWDIPANAVNTDYTFTVSVSNGIATALADYTLTVYGGEPQVKTVYGTPKTIVRTIETAPVVTPVATQYYPTTVTAPVVVATGRTVVPTNYSYYGATAYGAFAPLAAEHVAINAFNIAIRVNAQKEMIVSWDTNKPTTGEVVFGYASQTRGADIEKTILNYDFTTGERAGVTTRHEANLGALSLNTTYYLRVISRADDHTDISREIVFIPMTTAQQTIEVQQHEGAASATGALMSFLTSGGFLFFLLLVILGLITYLIILNRRPGIAAASEQGTHADEPHLEFYPQKHR